MIGGQKRSRGQRISPEDRMRYDRMLSERHYAWGRNCPAVDLDFLLCEFNHGLSVAIVDYKHWKADLEDTNGWTYNTLSQLYGPSGNQLPFFVARYWPDIWAFKLKAVNEAAINALVSIGRRADRSELPEWISLTEKRYVKIMYELRRIALEGEDKEKVERLNDVLPPADESAAA